MNQFDQQKQEIIKSFKDGEWISQKTQERFLKLQLYAKNYLKLLKCRDNYSLYIRNYLMNKLVTVSDSLYETDYFLWLEQQAITIKNRDLDGLDWENLLEEIEYLGREQINGVNSLLKQIIIYR